ncbi:hypothetical protein BBP40_004966 [Aspergillus hancockii]|nr:hypothetical protein BBP40_004966 [Aspergillus hancockii]
MRFTFLLLVAALTAKLSMAWSIEVYSGNKYIPAMQDAVHWGSIKYHCGTALAYLESDCTGSADPNGLPPKVKDGDCFGATKYRYIS